MKEAIEFILSEIELLSKCEDKDLFKEAMKMHLHFGVCFKLMREGFVKELVYEISDLGMKFISDNANLFSDQLIFDCDYWFIATCEPYSINNNKDLARESLRARKTVLEGILSTL